LTDLTDHPGYTAWAQTQFGTSRLGAGMALNNLQPNFNDEMMLLENGYFERPAANRLPNGIILIGGPPERFHLGIDQIATDGNACSSITCSR
jgi:hypothetical protein